MSMVHKECSLGDDCKRKMVYVGYSEGKPEK